MPHAFSPSSSQLSKKFWKNRIHAPGSPSSVLLVQVLAQEGGHLATLLHFRLGRPVEGGPSLVVNSVCWGAACVTDMNS